MLAELAMEEQVRGELDRVQAEGLDPLREGLWLASLTYLADAARAIAHQEVASLVYPLLAPLAGRNVMIGHGVACYGAADRYLGMLAATLGKRDVVLAISTTGKPREIVDAATIAKEYGATIVAITKPNSPLAMAADIPLGLYVPETPNALKPTAARFAFLAAIDLLAALTAYRSPRETQERMRRIKYALVNLGDGDADGPLGD